LSGGGRITLADIQPIINVDMFHIERAAEEIVKEVGSGAGRRCDGFLHHAV
jgi:hypothetical protein